MTYSTVVWILCCNVDLSLSGVCIHSREAVSSRHPRPDRAELASSDLSDSDRLVSETGSTSEHSVAAKWTGGTWLSDGNDGQIWPYSGGGHKKQRWSFCCLQRTYGPACRERKHKPVCDIWPILTEDGYDHPESQHSKKILCHTVSSLFNLKTSTNVYQCHWHCYITAHCYFL